MQTASTQAPQPELHIRADENTAYKKVAELMSEASKVGLTRIGFVTDPK
jgi:biopolymer transport protein ExbD